MKRLFIIFILINIFGFETICQSRWNNSYHNEISAPANRVIEHYDHGYLLTGRVYHNHPRYNWLIKTDINGNILWEKTIGEGINSLQLWGMEMNDNKEIYLSGFTTIEDPYGFSDPMLIKLNKCGEKEWCRIFPTPDHTDYGYDLCTTPDGGCAMILTITGLDYFNDRVCLTKFAGNGDFLWKQCYNSPDTVAMGNEECFDVILTPDNGFLLTGWCYYSNPGDTASWACPYYIKTDQDGNLEWETIAGFIPDTIGGQGWNTIIGPNSNFYYSSISHYYRDRTNAPAILKMDLQGNIVGSYDIAAPDEVGILYESKFINDSSLICSAGWGSNNSAVPKAVIIDTLGSVVNDQFLLDNTFMSVVRTTFDGKFLFYTQDYIEAENMFENYLFKLNPQLQSDTIYTKSYTYDSLCPYQIVSDTIVQDSCGLIVGMEELKPEKEEERNGILIYPNPAQNRFNISILSAIGNEFTNSSYITEIFDIYGRKVKEIKIPKGKNEIEVDVNGWRKGLYLVRVRIGQSFVGCEKVVVN